MFDGDGNKLNPNDDDNLNDDSPITWCYIRVQGRIKFKIKRCTDNDDYQMPFKRAETGLWRDLSTWQGDYTQNK